MTLDATGKDVDFMVIPADAPAEITFLATIGGKQYSASVTPGEALAQGLIHTYTLTLSAAGMTVSTVNVTPWGNGQTGSGDLTPYNPWKNIANGVYAVSADGKPVEVASADASCIGVALITANQKIMIAKADATDGSNNTLYWGKNLYQKDVAGITETTDQSVAKTDFNGKANTDAIIAAYSQHSVAMDSRDMCKVLSTYTEGGFTDWYVPAAGQLYEMYNKKSDINASLAKIGGTAFAGYSYWSSSEYSSNYAWCVSFDYGGVNYYKSNDSRVRLVRDIE